MQPNHVTSLMDALKKDRISPHPRYPHQAVYSLRDEHVATAVMNRLLGGRSIIGITALEYNFFTGLNQFYFEFSAPPGGGPGRDAVLVIMDSQCNVIGFVDPFDPTQPNLRVPALPEKGALPFVLSRPSATGYMLSYTLGEAASYARDVPSEDFYARLISSGGGGCQALGNASDTTSPVSTYRPYQLNPCKQAHIKGLVAVDCEGGLEYQEMVDYVADD